MVTLSDQFGAPHFPGNNSKGWSQGKLFKDPKPTDEHRYQRGYTPERMQEVRGARMDIDAGPSQVPDRVRAGPFTEHGGERHVQEVIARSTTPMHEINVPKTPWGSDRDPDDVFPLHINAGVTSGMGARGRSFAGTYKGGGSHERGEIDLAGGALGNHLGNERAGQTLLHELGHYKSAKVEHNDSAHYRTPSQRGKEEAVADDNEMERWRPDPRDVRAGRSKAPQASYENSGAFMGMGGQKAHGPYVRARKTLNPMEKEVIKAHGFRPQGLAKQLAAQKTPADRDGSFEHSGGLFGVSPGRQGDMTKQEVDVENNKLFHRGNDEERNWQPNQHHVFNLAQFQKERLAKNAAAKELEGVKARRIGEARKWLADNPDPPGWGHGVLEKF